MAGDDDDDEGARRAAAAMAAAEASPLQQRWDADHEDVSFALGSAQGEEMLALEDLERTANKLVFTLGMLNVALTAFLAGGHAAWIPAVYAVKAPVLIGVRALRYARARAWPFMLDFCYWANALLLLTLWRGGGPTLFRVVFALTTGPMLWACLTFRNALVLHSLDRTTSLFIHLTAALTTWAVRWHAYVDVDPDLAARYRTGCDARYAADAATSGCAADDDAWRLVLLPLCVYAAFQLAHAVVFGTLLRPVLRRDRQLRTTLRYLAGDRRTLMGRLLHAAGRRWRVPAFYAINIAYAGVTMSIMPLLWRSYVLHTALLWFISTGVIWNGASYYFEVLMRWHVRKQQQQQRQKQT